MSESQQSYYLYDASEAAAGAVAVIFAISFVATLIQIIHRRAWIWLVMLLAVAMEVVGYVARVISAKNTDEKGPYVIQFTLILLSPVLMAGVIYALFSRIVFWVIPPSSRTTKFLWVPPRFITLIFVGFDILSLLIQFGAAILITATDPTDDDVQSKLDTGKTLGVLGVGLQLAGFGLFTIVAVRFHFASKKVDESHFKQNQAVTGVTRHWSKLLLAVNWSCLLILIRSIFRMIEFAEGKSGETQKAEWYMYVFDTTPILLVALSYNVIFPGRYLKFLGLRIPKEHRRLKQDPETIAMSNWHDQTQQGWSAPPLSQQQQYQGY